jgi:hydrogenase expression/formation protein HypE
VYSGLPQGKLPAELLARLLAALPASDAVLGPRPGEDAAVLAAPEGYLVVTSDPITFTAERIGRYAVHVNANDIAAMGAEPRWLLAAVLLPPGTQEQEVAALLADLGSASAEAGISLVGGHTEVTDAVNRVVVVGTTLGSVVPDRLVTSGGARPGDVVLLSKPVAIEGTAVLAREAAAQLRARGISDVELRDAAALLDEQGISVLPESRILCRGALPHAMHDVTEGGLATALRELAEASAVGLRVEHAAIPVLPACARFCSVLGLDSLGLLGSGSLLAAAALDDADAKLAALRAAGMAAARIGTVTEARALNLVAPDGSSRSLPAFPRDEIARFFEQRRS